MFQEEEVAAGPAKPSKEDLALRVRPPPTQGPSWGYFKVNFHQGCQLLTKNQNKMAPRTGKRLQDRGRDIPRKGLLWFCSVADAGCLAIRYQSLSLLEP